MRRDPYLQRFEFTALSARHVEVDRCSMMRVNGQTLSACRSRQLYREMPQALINASDRRVGI